MSAALIAYIRCNKRVYDRGVIPSMEAEFFSPLARPSTTILGNPLAIDRSPHIGTREPALCSYGVVKRWWTVIRPPVRWQGELTCIITGACNTVARIGEMRYTAVRHGAPSCPVSRAPDVYGASTPDVAGLQCVPLWYHTTPLLSTCPVRSQRTSLLLQPFPYLLHSGVVKL